MPGEGEKRRMMKKRRRKQLDLPGKIWNSPLRWGIYLLLAVLIGLAGEGIYNLPVDQQDDYFYIPETEVKMDNFSLIEGNAFVSGGGQASLTFSFEKQYVDKLFYRFSYNNKDAFSCQIQVHAYPDGETPQDKLLTDTNNYVLTSSTVNVRMTADRITILLPENSDSVTIRNIAINNTENISLFRWAFVSLCAFAVLTLLDLALRNIQVKLEWLFLFASLSVGMLTILAMPAHKIGLDEEIHFGRSYFFGETIRGDDTLEFPSGIQELITPSLSNWPMHLPESEQEMKEEDAYRDKYVDYQKQYDDVTWTEDSNYALSLSTLSYFPQWLMLKIGMLLGLPFSMVYRMGRMGNLFLYSAVVFFAIRHMKKGKRILMVMALTPSVMMSAMTYTYDCSVNAFSFLGVSYLLTEWMERSRSISYRNCAVFTVSFVLASLPKPVYIPMILLALLFPKEKFRSQKERYLFKGGILVVFAAMMSTFMLPVLTQPSSYAGDSRGGDTSVAGQLVHIFTHPWAYTKLLLSSIRKTFFDYTIGAEGIGRMGHLPLVNNVVPLVGLTIYTMATDQREEEKTKPAIWQRAAVLLVVFCVLCLIWTALYLSFTPVGADQINGVQGRYYIPLTLLILLALSPSGIKNRFSPARDTVLIYGCSLWILLTMVYSVLIVHTF